MQFGKHFVNLKDKRISMKIKLMVIVSMVMAVAACKPSVPNSPDSSSYGKTVQPFHQIPAEDQEGGENPDQSNRNCRFLLVAIVITRLWYSFAGYISNV